MAVSTIYCKKCKGDVRVPELSPVARAAVGASAARDPLEATRAVKTATGWDLREAKRTALHLTRRRGKCHRCDAALAEREGTCPECASVNIDWLPDAS
jgi:Zn finger protein HypA/HybF involved in hydrogenase expression